MTEAGGGYEVGQARRDDGNLPADVTSFVGRQDELRDAEELFARGVRHVTLTGTGGVGKTRLAIKVGQRAAERGTYDHGVWLVALSLSFMVSGLDGAPG